MIDHNLCVKKKLNIFHIKKLFQIRFCENCQVSSKSDYRWAFHPSIGIKVGPQVGNLATICRRFRGGDRYKEIRQSWKWRRLLSFSLLDEVNSRRKRATNVDWWEVNAECPLDHPHRHPHHHFAFPLHGVTGLLRNCSNSPLFNIRATKFVQPIFRVVTALFHSFAKMRAAASIEMHHWVRNCQNYFV